MTVLQILENSQESNRVESYFSTVIGLVILFKQDPTTSVLVRTFQNFQNKYFLCNTSIRLLLNLQTILIVPSPSFLPYMYVGQDGEES